MKVKLNGNDFYEISAPFGDVSNIHPTGHTGVDLIMEAGTKLFSPVDGIVERIVDYGNENIGRGIIIKTDSGESVIMGHLSDIKVNIGQSISQGDFVALSGNTGFSTGDHLHLGLKDENGGFIDPDSLLEVDQEIKLFEKFLENGKINQYSNDSLKDKGMWEFFNDWRKEGFFEAMYDKPFSEVLKDFFLDLLYEISMFFLAHGNLFLLFPAIAIMFLTFLIGRNKYTKWIIPLWFGYFVSTVLYRIYG